MRLAAALGKEKPEKAGGRAGAEIYRALRSFTATIWRSFPPACSTTSVFKTLPVLRFEPFCSS